MSIFYQVTALELVPLFIRGWRSENGIGYKNQLGINMILRESGKEGRGGGH